jgi:hypothetical protein
VENGCRKLLKAVQSFTEAFILVFTVVIISLCKWLHKATQSSTKLHRGFYISVYSCYYFPVENGYTKLLKAVQSFTEAFILVVNSCIISL